jgi:Ca-activated chloride channel family protein
VVAPRYIPGSPLGGASAGSGVAADTDAVPDASRITPPVLLPGFPNPVRLTLSAEIDPAGMPLAGIRCSLHATAEEAGESSRTIVRLRPGERLDRDFILRLAVASHDEVASALVLTRDPGEGDGEGTAQGTFSLTLMPPDSTAPQRPKDVVLVLDRSGSMGGWKMVAARRAAARIVDTLTDADRFAMLCFDNAVERVPDRSVGLTQASDRNRFRAIEQLARIDARGGTEMLEPLADAVRLLSGATDGAARDHVLVLVTDGQVGNEDQILRRITSSLGQIRVHVVGIDKAVNAGFLSRLAAAGRGRCELVESEDRLDEAAARIHRRIGAPLVTQLALAADGLGIESGTVAPSRLPDLFPGVPVTVAGRWRGQAGGTVTVTGVSADGTPFETKAVAAIGGTSASTANWARAHLRDLEDRYASYAGHNTSELTRLEQRITGVSLRFGVLCRFTAFLAVDSRVVTDGAAPHRVTQPVELPAGWEPAGLGMPLPTRAFAAGAMPAPPAAGSAVAPDSWESAPGDAVYLAGRSRSTAMPMQAPDGARPGAPHPGSSRRVASRQVAPRRDAFGAGMPVGSAPKLDRGGDTWLVAVRDQLADEVAALRPEREAPDDERLRLLADLGTRLAGLLTWLAANPADTSALAGLAELVTKLQACDAPGAPRGADLDALWDEAIRLLTEFTRPDGKGAGGGGRKDFWKRRR